MLPVNCQLFFASQVKAIKITLSRLVECWVINQGNRWHVRGYFKVNVIYLQICLVNQSTSFMAISLAFNVIWLFYTFMSSLSRPIFDSYDAPSILTILSKIYICTFPWVYFITMHLVYADLHLDSFSKP